MTAMSALWIVLISVFGFLVLLAIASVIAYQKLAIPAFRPLTEEQRAACAQIVKDRKGYPWVCAHAVKTGMCPCLPCKKQEEMLGKK